MDISAQHYGIYCDDIEASVKFYTEVLGFDVLFRANADEAGIPLAMAWIKHPGGIVIELLGLEGYKSSEAANQDRNHIALRVKDMDAVVADLKAHGIAMETEPFDTALEFDQPLGANADVYAACNDKGVTLKVGFFRGPSGERFELMQDNIGGI
ncbi:MAG: VOC family protein [Coriobacteriales bacterium]|jgi:catechol 2,3-dioxygenase-like lactoylglutathione lyase family enzyme|nr:VOC family protein [Coriobacteriales bacterium]